MIPNGVKISVMFSFESSVSSMMRVITRSLLRLIERLEFTNCRRVSLSSSSSLSMSSWMNFSCAWMDALPIPSAMIVSAGCFDREPLMGDRVKSLSCSPSTVDSNTSDSNLIAPSASRIVLPALKVNGVGSDSGSDTPNMSVYALRSDVSESREPSFVSLRLVHTVAMLSLPPSASRSFLYVSLSDSGLYGSEKADRSDSLILMTRKSSTTWTCSDVASYCFAFLSSVIL